MATKKRSIKSKNPTRKGQPKALYNIWHDEDNAALIVNLRKVLNVDGMLKATIRRKVVWTPDEMIGFMDGRMTRVRVSMLPRLILLDMRATSGGKNVSFASYIDRCRAEGVDLV